MCISSGVGETQRATCDVIDTYGIVVDLIINYLSQLSEIRSNDNIGHHRPAWKWLNSSGKNIIFNTGLQMLEQRPVKATAIVPHD